MQSDCGERVYVDHLLAEHRRLDQLIRCTLATLPAWEDAESSAWLPAMTAGLRAIHDELTHHFREEEAGGCLEEAVARHPALSSEVADTQAEHASLLDDLEALIRQAERFTRPTPHDAHALGQELRAIVQALHQHEARENQVMQRGFSLSLENDDRT